MCFVLAGLGSGVWFQFVDDKMISELLLDLMKLNLKFAVSFLQLT